MGGLSELSRRERQIMDVVFANCGATVNQVVAALDDPPTSMAVRRMLHILEKKGHLRRRKQGREVIYIARQSKDKAGINALERVLETFFGGSLADALSVHLHSRKTELGEGERARLIELIEQARKEGR